MSVFQELGWCLSVNPLPLMISFGESVSKGSGVGWLNKLLAPPSPAVSCKTLTSYFYDQVLLKIFFLNPPHLLSPPSLWPVIPQKLPGWALSGESQLPPRESGLSGRSGLEDLGTPLALGVRPAWGKICDRVTPDLGKLLNSFKPWFPRLHMELE